MGFSMTSNSAIRKKEKIERMNRNIFIRVGGRSFLTLIVVRPDASVINSNFASPIS